MSPEFYRIGVLIHAPLFTDTDSLIYGGETLFEATDGEVLADALEDVGQMLLAAVAG